MRTFLLAAALAGAAPCLPAVPSGDWGVVVRDGVEDRLLVVGTLSVRGDGHFILECRVSGPAARTETRTAVWGVVAVAGDVVTGRVAGGEDALQLPGLSFTLRLGARPGRWESNVPGCPQTGRIPQ